MLIDESKCKRLGIELFENGSHHYLYMIVFRNYSVRDYLQELKGFDIARHDQLLARIHRIAISRRPWRKELFNWLSDDIYEIKSHKDRVACFFEEGNSIIMTHGFKKQKQKAPPAEIKKAIEIRKEYLVRKMEDDDENR